MSAPGPYLIDTNVISEPKKVTPEPRVLSFFGSHAATEFFLSVLTFGELKKGAANKRAKDPLGADALLAWIRQIESSFADRILPVDNKIAAVWGEFSAGRTRPVLDTYLAATAVVYNLTLVTRNTRDFVDLPITLFNPWLP